MIIAVGYNGCSVVICHSSSLLYEEKHIMKHTKASLQFDCCWVLCIFQVILDASITFQNSSMICLFVQTPVTHVIECGSASLLRMLRRIRYVSRLLRKMEKKSVEESLHCYTYYIELLKYNT